MDVPTMSRVHRERVLLVGGQRALVMQLAHPKVAAGVAAHSDFPARALERLRRTLDLTLATVFGSEREAEDATAGIRAVHDRVVGVGREAGAYAANDPELLLWVNATLIDSTMLVYDRFVRALSEEDWNRYYEETRLSAPLFGIPSSNVPPDLRAFRAYVRRMVEGDELKASADGARLVRDVLRPPLPLALRPPTAAVRLLTLALLPPRILDLFGLRSGPAARLVLAGASRASRAVLPLLPPVVREFSRARGR
jgi:uncharacterized protein (DUF2236 family)